jgi:thioredoxin
MLDRPIRMNDSNFDRIVHDASATLLVDFYADWCVPCKIMSPVLDEIAHEHRGRVLIAKLDTETNPNTAARFNIRSIPTVIVFERGVEKSRQSGAMRQDQIETLLGLKAGRAES